MVGDFLASRGMGDHPSRRVAWGGPLGEENRAACRCGQGGRGAAVLRPDQPVREAVWCGSNTFRKKAIKSRPEVFC